ncbi:MAG: hypothetical protein WCF79_10350, partial [Rhodomicrobium sp.]
MYTSGDWRHLLVNLSLTLSSAFFILKDLRRKRLSGRLMPLKPAPILDNMGKIPNGTPFRRLRRSVSRCTQAL